MQVLQTELYRSLSEGSALACEELDYEI